MTEKWDLLLRSLRLFTSLLLKWNLYLHLLHSFTSLLLKWKNLCTFNTLFHFTIIKIKLSTLNTLFYFTTIKVISLTMLTAMCYFTTINPRDETTVTTLQLSVKYFFSQEFQCFFKICMRDSNFTARKFSGVLNALLPPFSSAESVYDHFLINIGISTCHSSKQENKKHIIDLWK